MVIALFGKPISQENLKYVQSVIDKLLLKQCRVLFHRQFYESLSGQVETGENIGFFDDMEDLAGKVDYFISIGGDGTILDAVTLVRDSGIPIMGINIGRLGFLSSIGKDEILPAIDKVLDGDFRIDSRTLVALSQPKDLFGDLSYALNELTITRKDTTSLIVLHVYIDDKYLNSYWADGLIIATPTGSTAYSLSSGGPILTPGSRNFVLTPIAPHNLTVRPVVIPDMSSIRVIVEGREDQFLVSLDSRKATIHSNFELVVEKAAFSINMIQMREKDFFMTIRDKLKWGLDARN
ncbi:MAG: NAD kinase [Bacteroidales bacterium]|jgi:NAD+ kinase|nr:NAD kinase [Bacteroidales bacterium]